MFSEIILTCDTRERDQNRVKIISDFFEKHNAIVQNEKLDNGDYLIEGNYKNIPIKLNIEMKTLTGDLFPSFDDLPTKLLNTFSTGSTVSLFIEEGEYQISFDDDSLDAWIQNPGMQAATGKKGVGTLGMYHNFCSSMSQAGVYVRAFRNVSQFPFVVAGLMNSIIKPIHRGLELSNPEKDFNKYMVNLLVGLPGIGAIKAAHGLQYIPNLERFLSLSLSDLKDIFGEAQGSKLYGFIRNESNKIKCSDNWDKFYADRLEKTKIKPRKSKIKPAEGITEINNTKLPAGWIESPETPIKQRELEPRVTDLIEYIRLGDRSFKNISEYFGFSPEYALGELYKLKNNNKIWFDNALKVWRFGHDKNPIPVSEDKDLDIGV